MVQQHGILQILTLPTHCRFRQHINIEAAVSGIGVIDEKIRYRKSRDTVLLERCTLVLELVRDKEGIVKGALLEKQSKFPRYNMNSKGKCDTT